jgi:hypothetical protein
MRQFLAPVLLAWVLCAPAAQAQIADSIKPADYAEPNTCPAGYDPIAAEKVCRLNAQAAEALTESACLASGFKFEANKCSTAGSKPPALSCKPLPGFEARIDNGKCDYRKVVPTSTAGQFMGDCLKVLSPPAGSGLVANGMYAVTDQDPVAGGDKMLTLLPGEVTLFPTIGCQQRSGVKVKQLASDLVNVSNRYGYTWGLLTMPYKYFPKQKSFISGAPIGAYIGWRAGQASSGFTFAAAATLGSVKADNLGKDPAGAEIVTGTTEVSALSFALGLVFDAAKEKGAKPFKAGVFVGTDIVNANPSIRYPYNRKTYVAIQLGYDFTDN